MTQTQYNEYIDDIITKGDGGDFESAFNQQYLADTEKRHPLWRAEHVSRCPVPLWEREELLRSITYNDTRYVQFDSPSILFPAMTPTVGGDLSVKLMSKSSPILLPDSELYDYRVQKVYALLTQFSIVTTPLIVAWTGMSYEDVSFALSVLYTSGIVKNAGDSWVHRERLGDLWSMKVSSAESKRYYDGLDALSQVLTLGGVSTDDIESPPGGESRSVIRHNLYLSEMMLRILENSDNVVSAWGDHFAAEHRFHTPSDDMMRRKSHGDAVLVTSNGSLVIIELSTSLISRKRDIATFVEKAASWVGVIANSDLDISVIFLDARWKNNRKLLFRGIYSGIMEHSSQYSPDEFSRMKALGHIGIANAAWWFPYDNSISQAATRLLAFSPYEYRFKPFDVPDPHFSEPSIRRNVVINSSLALHNPPWIKDTPRPREFGTLDKGDSQVHDASRQRSTEW